jgi:hypothetical protein
MEQGRESRKKLWRCRSMEECLPNLWEGLDSIPSTAKKRRRGSGGKGREGGRYSGRLL